MVFLFCENVTNILIESIFLKKVLDFYTQWVYNKDTKGKQRAFPNDRKEKIMIKDVQSSAAALYDGGWRAADKEDLIEEYELTADEAAEICELLQEYEEKDTWEERKEL